MPKRRKLFFLALILLIIGRILWVNWNCSVTYKIIAEKDSIRMDNVLYSVKSVTSFRQLTECKGYVPSLEMEERSMTKIMLEFLEKIDGDAASMEQEYIGVDVCLHVTNFSDVEIYPEWEVVARGKYWSAYRQFVYHIQMGDLPDPASLIIAPGEEAELHYIFLFYSWDVMKPVYDEILSVPFSVDFHRPHCLYQLICMADTPK